MPPRKPRDQAPPRRRLRAQLIGLAVAGFVLAGPLTAILYGVYRAA
jgi:hypothetical protein